MGKELSATVVEKTVAIEREEDEKEKEKERLVEGEAAAVKHILKLPP